MGFGRLFPSLGSARGPLLWLCLVVGVNQLGFGIVSPSLPLYANTFGVSEAAIGLTVGVYGLGRLVLALPSGQLADRFGRRWILLAGTLVTSVGSLLCGLAPTFELLILFRLIAGAGAGMVLTGAQVILTDISTPENRGRMLSIYQGWFILAVGLGPAPGGLIAEHFGFRAPFFAFAGLALAAGLFAHVKVRESRGTALPAARPGGAAPVKKPRPWHVLAIPGIALAGLVTFAQTFSRTGAVFTIAPLYGHESLGLTPSQIGWTFTLGSLLMMGAVGVSGFLLDRHGRKAAIVPSTLLSGGAFVAFALAGSYPMYLLAGALWGITGGIGSAAPAAYAADRAPREAVGLAMGVYRTLGEFGYLTGATLLGLIADRAGASVALFFTAGIFLVVGLSFWLWAPEERRRRAICLRSPAGGTPARRPADPVGRPD